MDQDGLPIVGTGIDYTKVKPLDQKRLLAFINHYISHTVQFLNHFSGVCEEKMTKIESQLHRMEITMNILEGKLSSIPGMDDVKLADGGGTASTATADTTSTPATSSSGEPAASAPAAPVAATGGPAPTDQQPPPPQPEEPDVLKVSQDPRYTRFFKMLNMGVPPPAIKMKMSSEGFNPNLLDTPDAPAPTGADVEEDNSSDFDEPFSDSD